MKKRVPVTEIMTKNVLTLSTKDNLDKAEELFKKIIFVTYPLPRGKK